MLTCKSLVRRDVVNEDGLLLFVSSGPVGWEPLPPWLAIVRPAPHGEPLSASHGQTGRTVRLVAYRAGISARR